MSRSEQALASLLDDDEALLETWSVDTINRGLAFSPPGMGSEETLGLSDRRLLWLDDELETVELSAVEGVKRESMSPSKGGMASIVGGLALLVGLLSTPLLWVLTELSLTLTLAPLGLGVVGFLSGLVAVRLGGTDPDGEVQHYLTVQTERSTVQVYATEGQVDAMARAIDDART